MSITWIDVLKLTVPFVTAILLVWIKAWIETSNARRAKQLAISRVLKEEIQGLPVAIDALVRKAEASRRGKVQFVAFAIPSIITKYADNLSEMNSSSAYFYSHLAASIEVANKGLDRLAYFTLERARTDVDGIATKLDRAIMGQAKITGSDFVSFGKSAISVLKELPPKRRNADSQSMVNIEKKLNSPSQKWKLGPKCPLKKIHILQVRPNLALHLTPSSEAVLHEYRRYSIYRKLNETYLDC